MNTTSPNPVPRLLKLPITAWAGFGLGAISGASCWIFTGSGIGLFFGGIGFAALLLPPLVLAETRISDRLLVAMGVCDGIALVWLISIWSSHVTFMQWLLCYVILMAWCLALVGSSAVIARILRSPIAASCIVVVVAMLWLSWPVWLSKPLLDHQQWTGYLVPPHPLFAINGVLRDQGIWSERPIAYQHLFTLGQDVPYVLPESIVMIVMVHGLIGGIGLVITAAKKRKVGSPE